MPPALSLALIVTLAVLLAIASASSALFWHRARSVPRSEVGRLADALADCRRVLESFVERPSPPIPSKPRSKVDVDPPMPSRRNNRGARRISAGPTLIAVPDLSTASTPTSGTAELGRRFGDVWELADAGASAEAIARRTGQPIGQVELILGLRRQLNAAAGGPP